LIPAVTAQHPRRSGGHYSAPDVQRWLHTLAYHLHQEDQADHSGSDLRLEELWRIAGDRRVRYLTAAVLMTACVTALLVNGVSYLVQVGAPQTLPVLLPALFGVVIGLGLLAATMWGLLTQSVNLQRLDLRTPVGRRRLAGGLTVGLTVGLAAGLVSGIAGWLTGGLVVGIAGGLVVGLEVRPAAIDLPHRLVSQGLAHTATRLLLGLVAGLAGGLGGGIAGGLGGGIVGGLAFVSNSPWPRYAVACLLLAWRGELPPRPAVFLDWAYDAGLVRLSGIAVQFRHREFQTWLIHGKQLEFPKPPSPAVSEPLDQTGKETKS
jgi:hypothetical protein